MCCSGSYPSPSSSILGGGVKSMNKTKIQQREARRRESRNRIEKIALYHDKIEMLRAMVDDADERGETENIPKLNARIRTLEQQIKYMS